MYVYVYMYIYIYTHTYIYTYIYIHIYTCKCIHIYMYSSDLGVPQRNYLQRVYLLFWQPPSVAGFRGDDTLFPSSPYKFIDPTNQSHPTT